MTTYFLDTSALVKRYVREQGSTSILDLAEPGKGNELLIAAITEVELCSALQRRRRENDLSVQDAANAYRWFREDCIAQYRIRVLDSAIIATAVRLLEAHPLRAYDSIQLSSCLEATASRVARGMSAVTFISADEALQRCAAAEGLSVFTIA